MNPENHSEKRKYAHEESSLELQTAKIASAVKTRDAKQAEFLLALKECAGTDREPAAVLDRWLELQIAQRDLDAQLSYAIRGLQRL